MTATAPEQVSLSYRQQAILLHCLRRWDGCTFGFWALFAACHFVSISCWMCWPLLSLCSGSHLCAANAVTTPQYVSFPLAIRHLVAIKFRSSTNRKLANNNVLMKYVWLLCFNGTPRQDLYSVPNLVALILQEQTTAAAVAIGRSLSLSQAGTSFGFSKQHACLTLSYFLHFTFGLVPAASIGFWEARPYPLPGVTPFCAPDANPHADHRLSCKQAVAASAALRHLKRSLLTPPLDYNLKYSRSWLET